MLRRFVEAARRAQIVTIVNLAGSEAELGELFTAELCETFEAEIAFVLTERPGGDGCAFVGAYGLTTEQRARLLEDERSMRALTSEETQLYQDDLLSLRARQLVLAPFAGNVVRGLVGVARLYDEQFDEGEVALLEAVVESMKHTVERIRLGVEREATTRRLEQLQRITGAVLSDLPLEGMLSELLDRVREVVAVDTAVILDAEPSDTAPTVRLAAGADDHIAEAVEIARQEGVTRRVLEERREIDVGITHVCDASESRETICSLIGVPMAVEGRAVGVLVAGALTPRDFSADDRSLLGLAADRGAVAIENARLYREAEERGQAALVLGYVADGVMLVDANGAVQFWNPAAEAITGLPAEEVLGLPVEEVIRDWDSLSRPVAIESVPAASTGRASTLPVQIGDRELWLSITAVSFPEGTVYAFRDLTEERRLEELKRDFIATVSHELRTPIAAVHGAAQTLGRDDVAFPEDLRRRLLGVIYDQSERLANLVNDILLASQVDSGRLVIASEQVDVPDLARRVIEAARAHAPSEISLELVEPPALPGVTTDRDKLRQVLANLVANAVKYSSGAGRVAVQLESRGNRLRIAVSDEGVGIPEFEQQRIFEKFYRLPNVINSVSGTGLGLYICRELVRRMGGSIWVESSEGAGSTFIVELPFAPD